VCDTTSAVSRRSIRWIWMKTLTEYMAMSYRMEIVEDKDEGGFVVSYPDLPGCITCGETVENAVANALDAKKHGLRQHWKKV